MPKKKKYDRMITLMITQKMYDDISTMSKRVDKDMSEYVRYCIEERIRRDK